MEEIKLFVNLQGSFVEFIPKEPFEIKRTRVDYLLKWEVSTMEFVNSRSNNYFDDLLRQRNNFFLESLVCEFRRGDIVLFNMDMNLSDKSVDYYNKVYEVSFSDNYSISRVLEEQKDTEFDAIIYKDLTKELTADIAVVQEDIYLEKAFNEEFEIISNAFHETEGSVIVANYRSKGDSQFDVLRNFEFQADAGKTFLSLEVIKDNVIIAQSILNYYEVTDVEVSIFIKFDFYFDNTITLELGEFYDFKLSAFNEDLDNKSIKAKRGFLSSVFYGHTYPFSGDYGYMTDPSTSEYSNYLVLNPTATPLLWDQSKEYISRFLTPSFGSAGISVNNQVALYNSDTYICVEANTGIEPDQEGSTRYWRRINTTKWSNVMTFSRSMSNALLTGLPAQAVTGSFPFTYFSNSNFNYFYKMLGGSSVQIQIPEPTYFPSVFNSLIDSLNTAGQYNILYDENTVCEFWTNDSIFKGAYFYDKSTVKRYFEDTLAVFQQVKVQTFLDMLADIFNLYPYFTNSNELRFIHASDINFFNEEKLDLTTFSGVNSSTEKQKIKLGLENATKQEKFLLEESGSFDFDSVTINYNSNEDEKQYEHRLLCNNILEMINPDTKVSDDGLCIVIADLNTDNILNFEGVTNYYATMYNIFESHLKFRRPYRKGTLVRGTNPIVSLETQQTRNAGEYDVPNLKVEDIDMFGLAKTDLSDVLGSSATIKEAIQISNSHFCSLSLLY